MCVTPAPSGRHRQTQRPLTSQRSQNSELLVSVRLSQSSKEAGDGGRCPQVSACSLCQMYIPHTHLHQKKTHTHARGQLVSIPLMRYHMSILFKSDQSVCMKINKLYYFIQYIAITLYANFKTLCVGNSGTC